MHRKEGLMFKNMGQTYADMKKLHEEAAGMPLEDIFMDHLNEPIETQDLLLQMANRSFEQAKYEWECHEEWRFADRDAERKFFYNSGKNDYDRQLAIDWALWKQRAEQAEAEAQRLRGIMQRHHKWKENAEKRAETAEAEVTRLREALETISRITEVYDNISGLTGVEIARKVLEETK